MQMQTVRRGVLALAAGLAILASGSWAASDPPSRVARLGYLAGTVSFSPAGENDWVQATVNRPLSNGDRLWTDPDAGARAEIQVGGAMIRMDAGTSLSILNLDDRIAQMQLTQGTLNVRVRRLDPNQVFEVDTPNLAFTLRQAGEYRIDVDPEGNATTIVVRSGKGEAYGEEASYVIDSRQPYRFTGTGLRDYQPVSAPRPDEFDRWASSRDRSYDNSRSARYVSSDVVGYQDLDANGTWRVDASYGNVWVPNRVEANWAPYSDGHWSWVDPWGWTWIDAAPWGYAVSHYGRWANMRGTWGWVPGPVRSRAYYAPALVAFVGGNNFQLSISSGNVGGVAWFPLAPREVYRPAYQVSRRYFENVNHSNTVINNAVIINQYNTTNITNVVYANRQVSGAMVAVPTATFIQSQSVSRGRQRISREATAGRPVAIAPLAAPTEKSVHGAATRGDKPPSKVFERPVVARSAVPAAHTGFAAQREQLAEKPGRPLDAARRQQLKPEAAVPAPIVKVLAPRADGPKVMRPPPAVAKPEQGRGQADARQERAGSVAPGAAPQGKEAVPAKPATPVAQEPRGKAVPNGNKTQPVAPASEPPKSVGRPRDVVTESPKQRGKPEPDGKRDQTTPAVVTMPEKPIAAPPPRPAPKAAPPQESAVPPAESRSKLEPRNRNETPTQPVVQPKAVAPPEAVRRPDRVQDSPASSPEPRNKPEQRNKSESRGNSEQRVPVVAPPPRAAEPRVSPPQVAAPAPVQQMPQQRAAPPPREAPPPQAAPRAPAPPQAAPAAERPNDRQRGGGDQQRQDDNRKPDK
ncbi:MAG: hypothetical protein Q8S26_12265 [Azonexus sp.]|nr:hypothetical protein [Azonexus sp.]